MGNSWEEHGFSLVLDAVPTNLLDKISDEATCLIQKRYRGDSLTDLESALAFARCRALDQFIALLTDISGSLPALRQLEESIAICTADLLLDLGKKLRQINVGLFYSAQDSPETTYEWHQESSYYADEFVVTAWLPLFRPIALVDGPMLVIPGSHATHLDFRSERQPGGFVSHIPLEMPEDSTIVACGLQLHHAVDVGGLVGTI